MAKEILTIDGLLPVDSLRILDIITDTDNSRDIATEYYAGDRLVRRDVAVSILRPLQYSAEAGSLG